MYGKEYHSVISARSLKSIEKWFENPLPQCTSTPTLSEIFPLSLRPDPSVWICLRSQNDSNRTTGVS